VASFGARTRWDASLARHLTGWLFVSGCAPRIKARFDAIVLLSVPREVMLQRIGNPLTNPFRKDAHERQRIRKLNPFGTRD
jgi:hypothetical protein